MNGESASSLCSTARYSVMSCGERREITAERWSASVDGLKFFVGDEVVAWFTEWSSFEKIIEINGASIDAFRKSLERVGFSVRARKSLHRLECNSFSDLLKLTREDLLEAKFCGPLCADEILEKRQLLSQ